MFSLTRGGPWYQLMRRIHATTPRGDVRWPPLVLVAWLPLVLASLVGLVRGGLDPMFTDLSVHVRFLVGLPLVVLAERVLEQRGRRAVRHLRTGRFANREMLDAILERTETLRDAWRVEVVLAAAAVLAGQAALWGWIAPAGFVHGVEDESALTFTRIWYAALALPMLQFLWLRWLWRWALWTYVLARVSRLRLATIAIHPDNAAGLGFLSDPTEAFAVYAASLTSVASAAWMVQLHAGVVTLPMLVPTFVGFLVLALALAFGPLLLFAGHLYRARRRDLPLHHELALTYVREFKRKWLVSPRTDEPVLGTPDLQSLNDLGGAFETTEKTLLVPIKSRPVVLVVLGAFAPMLPVPLTAMPLADVGARLGKALLGGLPI